MVVGLLYLVGMSGATSNTTAVVNEIGTTEKGSRERVSDHRRRHQDKEDDTHSTLARTSLLALQSRSDQEGNSINLPQNNPTVNSLDNNISEQNSATNTSAERAIDPDRNDKSEESDTGAEGEEDLDGPDAIHQRNLDYRRRHGIDENFDPNQHLEAVRQQYEAMEAEKAERASRPDAIPGTNWVSLGPSNGAGRMTAIAVHPGIAGTVYVGAAGGGVWNITDGGASWTVLTDSITNLSVGALTIAPSSSNTIYLGTGEANSNGDSIPGIGFLKSTDGGQTWQFPSSVISRAFSKISVHPANANELVIATDDGGFRSTNGGQNWTNVIAGPSQVKDLIRHPNNPQILYATTRFPTQILKSTDGGMTWVAKNNGVPVQSLYRMSITMAPSNPLIMYTAGESTDGLGARMYKTVDGG